MLKSVEIKKFRSCRSTKIEFGTSVCALTGRNGVGKSNILNAIDWVSRSVITSETLRIGLNDYAAQVPEDIEFGMKIKIDEHNYIYRILVRLNLSKDRNPSQYEFPGLVESLALEGEDGAERTIFDRNGETITLAVRKDPIRTPQWTPAPAALKSLLTNDDPEREHINKIITFFNGTRYYPLDDTDKETDLILEYTYNEWKLRHQTGGDPTTSIAMRIIYMLDEDRELFEEFQHIIGPAGLDVIEQIGKSYINPAEVVGSNNPVLFGSRLLSIYFKPSKQMGGADGFFPFSALSLGTRRVIQIVVSMLFDKRSLMLIEHPEDSIHPGLLRKLIDLLRTYSSQSQTIFTTHSPEVLDILEPEEIILVTAPEGSTQARKLEPDEIGLAKEFLKNEGTLSEFLEPLDNL